MEFWIQKVNIKVIVKTARSINSTNDMNFFFQVVICTQIGNKNLYTETLLTDLHSYDVNRYFVTKYLVVHHQCALELVTV